MSEAQISLTKDAAKRVAWIAARQEKPPILRLAVDGGGCAGFTYKFELAAEAESDDEVVETDGVKDVGKIEAFVAAASAAFVGRS